MTVKVSILSFKSTKTNFIQNESQFKVTGHLFKIFFLLSFAFFLYFPECKNGCGSLLCSENCDFKDRHSKIECEILRTNLSNVQNPGRWLTVFRSLLLKESEKGRKWDALQLLEDNLGDRKDCEIMTRNMSDVVKPIVELFRSNCFTPTEILRVCGILDSNSFRIDGIGNRGLFGLASMVNHNCCPNSRVSFDRNANLTLRSKRKIEPGEEITITYCSPLLG